MNRAELSALREALDAVLSWPDAVREQVAAWLNAAPAKTARAKPNGHAARGDGEADARLLAALMADRDTRVVDLARLTKAKGTTVSERLKRLAARGLAVKGETGWRRADPYAAVAMTAAEEAELAAPPAAQHAPWVAPISTYDAGRGALARACLTDRAHDRCASRLFLGVRPWPRFFSGSGCCSSPTQTR